MGGRSAYSALATVDNPAATVVMFRRRDPTKFELVAEFAFTDLAVMAARAITERYKYPTEVRYRKKGVKPRRFEWLPAETERVVEVPRAEA